MLLLSIVWNSISLYPFQLGKELFPNRKCDICTDTEISVFEIYVQTLLEIVTNFI